MRDWITVLVAVLASIGVGCKPATEDRQPPKSLPAADPEMTPAVVQHFEDFSDAGGAMKIHGQGVEEEINGPLQNLIYPYAQPAEGGDASINLSATESKTISGHDGQPGVLCFEITRIEGHIDHFGLVYLGNNDESEIHIESWQERDLDDEMLAGTFLEFRYRSTNRNGPKYNVRLEPELHDSWPRRLDFGAIEAQTNWQAFAVSLASGTNVSAFLEMMRTDKPTRFKLVWGQEGPSSNYQSGDVLLIDDIRIATHE